MKTQLPLIILSILGLISCSSENDEANIEKSIALNTKLLSVSNGHSLSNIQVGDTLTYKFEINSNVPEGDSYIVPETISTLKHQLLNSDYKLFYNKLKCDTIKCNAKIGQFKILVLKAGNFQHNYTALQFAKESKSNLNYSNKQEIVFNAVKIIAYRYRWEWKITGNWLFGHRYYYRHFHKLYIDCGNQQNDNYLQALEYKLKYWSYNTDNIGFIENTNLNFHPYQETENGNALPVQVANIDKITFSKPLNNIITTIEYDNIPVQNLGTHSDWGWDGNNNL